MTGSTEISLRRYLFLHAALLFFMTSIQGFTLVKAYAKNQSSGSNHLRVHLDGFISALWLAAMASSMDYSTSSFKVRRFMASCALIFSWTQFFSTYVLVRYNLALGKWFNGNQLHDYVFGVVMFVSNPAALIAILLWIWGFLRLHEGDKAAKAPARSTRSKGKRA